MLALAALSVILIPYLSISFYSALTHSSWFSLPDKTQDVNSWKESPGHPILPWHSPWILQQGTQCICISVEGLIRRQSYIIYYIITYSSFSTSTSLPPHPPLPACLALFLSHSHLPPLEKEESRSKKMQLEFPS